MEKKKSHRKLKITLISIAVVLALLIGACTVYLLDYYKADMPAIEAFLAETGMEYRTLENGNILLAPPDATKGLIFYPGGKVEHRAYIPLMSALAQRGFLCVLVEMPFNLAVFDISAADGIRENYPQIEEWYIGGHSLGGSMACSYLEDHHTEFAGLILLGSYSASDLSQTDLKVLSVYGSEDKVMNRDKYQDGKGNLPSNLVENILQGGCHAYFGMYGPQSGDGTPTVTNKEQILTTADLIAAFAGRKVR